jgi:(2Fe-2S) ferredoxin
MRKETIPQARIFVCVNEKPAPKVSCLKGEGEKCVVWLKEEVKKRHLQDKIWVSRTKCQGYCHPQGTVVTFEPIHEQYSDVTFPEMQNLFEEFLKKINV